MSGFSGSDSGSKLVDRERKTRQSYVVTLEYRFNPWSLARDASVPVWIPLAGSDGRQQIEILQISEGQELVDQRGNKSLFATVVPRQVLSYEAKITLHDFDYRRDRLDLPGPSPADLAPAPLIPLSEPIRIKASELSAGKDPEAAARAIFAFVRDHVSYRRAPRRGAQTALEFGQGDCGEYAVLFCALCRAAGIPARPVYGYIAAPAWRGWHAWAECWLEGYGWVPVDPNLERERVYFAPILDMPNREGIFFGSLDRYRVVFSRGTGLAWPGEACPGPTPPGSPSFQIDGQPFAFFHELREGTVPYLQIGYACIQNPAPAEGFRALFAPPYRVGIKSQSQRLPKSFAELTTWVVSLPRIFYLVLLLMLLAVVTGMAGGGFVWIYRAAQLGFQVVVTGYLVRSALFLPRARSERLFYAAIALLIICQAVSEVWQWFG